MICDKCGNNIEIEHHHIHPAFMNNGKRQGSTVKLCKKCHGIVHQTIIPSILFRNVMNKELVIAEVKQTTLEWISKENKQIKCSNCDADLDIEDKICPYCNKLNGDNYED